MSNRFENTTDRALRLGGVTSVKPGNFTLAADARYLAKRPLFKAYIQDGSIVSVISKKDGKQALTADKKGSEKKEPKQGMTASEKDSGNGKSA